MDEAQLQTRLSRISTAWTLVHRAHCDSTDESAAARNQLMQRYHQAAYRYLLVALRDPDAADEVFQEFALRFVRGSFRGADPGRGKFRQFIKTVLINLVIDYRKRLSGGPHLEDMKLEPTVVDLQREQSEAAFKSSWREELLRRAWASLEEVQRDEGGFSYSVLRFRSRNPRLSSAEMAARLSSQLRPEKPWNESGIRKLLQRSREKFAEILLREVGHSLEGPTLDQLEEELAELELLAYCRSALKRRRA